MPLARCAGAPRQKTKFLWVPLGSWKKRRSVRFGSEKKGAASITSTTSTTRRASFFKGVWQSEGLRQLRLQAVWCRLSRPTSLSRRNRSESRRGVGVSEPARRRGFPGVLPFTRGEGKWSRCLAREGREAALSCGACAQNQARGAPRASPQRLSSI